MHKRNVTANFNARQIFYDLVMILSAFVISSFLYQSIQGVMLMEAHLWILLLFSGIFVLVMFLYRMYNVTTFYYHDRIVLRTMIATAVSGFFISMVIFMLKLSQTSRFFFVLFCVLSFVLVVVQRIALRMIYRAGWIRPATRALFVGGDRLFEEFSHYLSQTAMKYQFVDTMHFEDEALMTPTDLEEYIVRNQIDEVIFAYGKNDGFDYKTYATVCEDMGITVRLALELFDLPVSQKYVSSIGTYPVITYHSVSLDQVQLFFKTVIDLVAGFVGIVLLSPVMAITALAIKLESPGPVLFKQKRAGINGKIFEIYKFRSMYMDAEERKKELMAQNKIKDGMMFKMDNDPRVTKVGRFIRKTSIDELPQFFNVLKGDMSLVGTRPPTLDEVEKYDRRQRRRISIKPGITGMWQVSGRSDIVDFEKVVELDRSYIDQWSLALDFKLLFKTAWVVLARKGSS